MKKVLNGKAVLVTGGTGSLGKVLVNRMLEGTYGKPSKIVIFSRDEAKQHEMRLHYMHKTAATDEVIYNNFNELIEFRIGDVRDFASVTSALQGIDIVFNAAALKQVPTCEYFPFEAVLTNVCGAQNIVRAIREHDLHIDTVVGISTDKACKPINLMGMTKAIQERIFIRANLDCRRTRFVVVRYGNVLASRGSVIPLFHNQIRYGGPVTITVENMTRFLLSLTDAVELIMAALKNAHPGEIYIPKIPAAKITDIATALIGSRDIPIRVTGVRPGEKIHEILVSEEEVNRCVARGPYYVIKPMLPELKDPAPEETRALAREYSSAEDLMDLTQTVDLLKSHKLMPGELEVAASREVLR